MIKILIVLSLVFACLSTSFLASAAEELHFNVIIPAFGGDVDCVVENKVYDDQFSWVLIDSNSNRANFWVLRQEGGARLSNTMYLQPENANQWFTLAYSNANAYAGQAVILRADGASPASGHTSGTFDAQ